MAGVLRSCIQSILKLLNSIIGMAGIAMILYSLWMIRIWSSHLDDAQLPAPWFIYTFLGLGIFLCFITCSGHIAAETANGHCLSCYMVFVFLLILLESGITADIFLNRDWEADFPEDPTGRFDEFKDFVRANFGMCKWVGLLIVAAQAFSLLLAMILRALGPDIGGNYDSDDDSTVAARLPLLRNAAQPSPFTADPRYLPQKEELWGVKIEDKSYR
ncbi:Tetraspanin-19 [Nymphaea thermarum]|nr:Tetraspanin-19 [Nymphaea thermarum]